MFQQLLTPVADSLALSFLVAVLPIATVLLLLGVVSVLIALGRPQIAALDLLAEGSGSG